MKNLYLISGLLLLISGLLVGAVAYGNSQYDGGFNAGYTQAQKETLALNEKAVQDATASANAQRRKDSQRIHRQQLNNTALKNQLAALKKQGEKDDAKKPDKYPADWRLTEFDLQLLKQFANTVNNSTAVGSDTRERPATAAPENSRAGNRPDQRAARSIPDKWHAFFRQPQPAERPDKSDKTAPTVTCCRARVILPDGVAMTTNMAGKESQAAPLPPPQRAGRFTHGGFV